MKSACFGGERAARRFSCTRGVVSALPRVARLDPTIVTFERKVNAMPKRLRCKMGAMLWPMHGSAQVA